MVDDVTMPPPQGSPPRPLAPTQAAPARTNPPANTPGALGTETYPDPPRDWRRTGSLLGAWVVVLGVVLGVGFGLRVVAETGKVDETKEDPLTPGQAALQYLSAVFQSNDHERANELSCPDMTVSSEQIEAGLKNSVDGAISAVTVTITGETSTGNGTAVTAAVRFNSDGSPDGRKFEVLVAGPEGAYCIANVTSNP